ncbi:MAG: hypothetical protein Q9157_003193 [Trypethelium eluteriae]
MASTTNVDASSTGSMGPPLIDNTTDLFNQEAGKKVALPGKRKRVALITRQQPNKSSKGILARIPKLLEYTGEYWHFLDGTKAASGSISKVDKTIILDIGHAFRCNSYDIILGFCLVQEATLMDGVPSEDVCQAYCPLYRVRRFADAEEAKTNMLLDATDHYISTIGSYVILGKGTQVDGLWCQDLEGETIGM